LAYRRTEAVATRLADNRRRILDAARELVAEGGFAHASMSAVAGRAQLATGTLYRYFPSKEALFRQVFREVSLREMGLLREIAQGDGPAARRLALVVRRFAGRAVRGRRLAYALLAEPVDVGLAEERAAFRRTHAEIFAHILADGARSGELSVDNPQLAAACIAGAIPTALVGSLAPESHELDRNSDAVITSLVMFCLRAVGADPALAETETTDIKIEDGETQERAYA